MSDYFSYFERLSDDVAQYYNIDRVSELKNYSHPIDENLIQCIWAEQLVHPDGLKTMNGDEVIVLNPGDWNHGPGPDFLGTEILFNGEVRRGDTELHLRSSDFKNHGHDRDYEYNNLVLHVFLSNTDGKEKDLLQNQQYVERVELEQFLFPDLETIRQTIVPEEIRFKDDASLGKCQPIFMDWDFESIQGFLNSSGRERLERKAGRMIEQLDGESIEQIFYQALMAIMGLKGSKALYFLLAKRATLAELTDFAGDVDLQERPYLIESLFYHLAGLIPEEKDDTKLDEAERIYLEGLRSYWEKLEPYFSDRLIPKTKKWHSGIRPSNFPNRRLSGIAHWLAPKLENQNLIPVLKKQFQQDFPALCNQKNVRKYVKLWQSNLMVNDDSHWCRRYSWGGKVARSQTALIGESNAQSIFLNVILPLILLLARIEKDQILEEQVFKLWAHFPPLAQNQIIKRMKHRLFENNENALALLNTEQRQQALHQVFNEFCKGDSQSCEQCAFFESHQQL